MRSLVVPGVDLMARRSQVGRLLMLPFPSDGRAVGEGGTARGHAVARASWWLSHSPNVTVPRVA